MLRGVSFFIFLYQGGILVNGVFANENEHLLQDLISALENRMLTKELLDEQVDDLLSLILTSREALKGQHQYD